jgi:hypothetical protein
VDRIVVLCIFQLLFLTVCEPSSSAQTRPILVQDVTVIDSTGSLPMPHMSVLIVGDTIKSIVPAAQAVTARKGQSVVDGRGKFLIAGLWDMHVHSLSRNQPDRFFPLFVANGVTGIRDMGGDIPLHEIAQIKKEIAGGSRIGPEIFAAGPILEGEHPFWPFSVVVKNAEDARRVIPILIADKADFLKVYNTLNREAYLSIATQARQAHIPFVGHVPDTITPLEASKLGQKSIEHLWGVPNYVSSSSESLRKMKAAADDAEDPKTARDLYYKLNETILASYDSNKANSLFEEFARNGTWQTPTMVVLRSYALIHDPALRKDPRNAYMPEDILRFWESMGGNPDVWNDEIQQRLFNRDIQIVKAMHVAHVPLLAGTDTPNPYTYPGFSLPEELELLVSAGLSPMEALQIATLRAAQFLGVQHEFGSVEPGKIANLVLLDANPLEDIRALKRVRAVIVRGHLLDRAKLDDLLATPKIAGSQGH